MEPTIDHVAVPAPDPEAAARWLAGILGADGVAPDGPDGDMFNVPLGGGFVLFTAGVVSERHHLAFRIGAKQFDAVIERLRSAGTAFGDDPEDATNGGTTDHLGGAGRAYFTSPDGHFFEVTVG